MVEVGFSVQHLLLSEAALPGVACFGIGVGDLFPLCAIFPALRARPG